jgi:hypothetical protein
VSTIIARHFVDFLNSKHQIAPKLTYFSFRVRPYGARFLFSSEAHGPTILLSVVDPSVLMK